MRGDTSAKSGRETCACEACVCETCVCETCVCETCVCEACVCEACVCEACVCATCLLSEPPKECRLVVLAYHPHRVHRERVAQLPERESQLVQLEVRRDELGLFLEVIDEGEVMREG